MHGYKVLMRKLFGKEKLCELLLGVVEKFCGKVQTGHMADCSECSNEPSMFDKNEGILWLAEQLLASHVALCSMELAVSSGFENCKGENL